MPNSEVTVERIASTIFEYNCAVTFPGSGFGDDTQLFGAIAINRESDGGS